MDGPHGDFSVRGATPHEPLDFSAPHQKNNNLREVNSDLELRSVILEAKQQKRPVVVKYGSPWCHACSKMMPTFFKLCNEYSNPLFVYADVEKCATSTSDVRYTPTFRFYRDGEKVDEFYGAGAQRLRDRVWLQS